MELANNMFRGKNKGDLKIAETFKIILQRIISVV